MSPSHAVCRFNFDFSAFADSWNQDVVGAEQDVLVGLQERGLAGDLIYRKTVGHLENYCNESRKDDVNIKRTMEPHNAVTSTLRQRLTVQSAAQEAAQEDGDDRPASFGMTPSGQTIIFPSVATAHIAQAEPASYAFARGTCLERRKRQADLGLTAEVVILAEGMEMLKTVMGAKSMWEVWARCRKRGCGVQLRLVAQRSLPE